MGHVEHGGFSASSLMFSEVKQQEFAPMAVGTPASDSKPHLECLDQERWPKVKDYAAFVCQIFCWGEPTPQV